MFIKDGKRFNIYAAVTIDETQYPAGFFTDPEAREAVGITEIPDPIRESDETHYNQELDEAPYLISTPKPQEMLEQARNAQTKQKIAALEAGQPRAVREALLSGDMSRLQDIEDEIAALRNQLV